MRIALSAICLLLAACTTGADPTAGKSPAVESQVTSIEGEYRLAGVDGEDIDLPHGITAAVTADRIEVQSDCIRLYWTYTLDNGAFAAETTPGMTCRRGLLPQESAIQAAFDAAETVRHTPANGLEFSGGGRSVTLFSQ